MTKRKSTGKAKRARAKPLRIPRDPVTGGQFLFDPKSGKPTNPEQRRPQSVPTPEDIAARQARARACIAEAEARRAEFRARLARRPVEMQRNGYKLPRDVAAFLSRLHDAPAFHFSDTQIEVERALELIEAAYMDGCRQGYIEGFVVRREVDRQRSRAGNAAKMKAPVRVGDRTVTRAERNEAMAKEFAELSQLMKPTPAMQRLADKYGFESWQGVAAAIKRFAKQTGQ